MRLQTNPLTVRTNVAATALLFAAVFIGLPKSLGAQTQSSQSASQEAQSGAQQENSKGTGVVPRGVKLIAQMPAEQPPRPFHFPKAETRTLENGLRIFVIPDHRQPSVAVRLVLMSAGAIHDPADMPGIASMTADMLTQGTKTRTAQQFAQAIDFVGGQINASASDDATYATATAVSRDLELGIKLLSDAVLHPAFSAEELERQRQQTLSGLRIEYSDPNYLASAAFARVVYGASPYGRPSDGTPQTVAKITRDDLVKFHDSAYAPNDALLAFAGDVTPERAFALAQKYFGPWEKKDLPAEEPAAPPQTQGLHFTIIDKPDAVQTQIRAGSIGIPRNSPDYIPLLVTNRIFGGGFNSRLNTEVRVKKGLTYGASSAFDASRFAGDFVADTFSRTEKTADATKLVVDLIAQMSSGNVQPQELKFAQDYLSGVYPIQSETAAQVATRILTVAEYGLSQDYNDTYQQKILSVSDDQVKEMAQKYFSGQNLDVVLVGNAAQFLPALKTDFPDAQWEQIPFKQLDLLSPNLRSTETPSAAPAATPEALAHGQQILMAAAQAAGGDSLRSISSLEFTEKGSIYTPQGALPITVQWQVAYPDKVHAEVTLPVAKVTQISDGKSAWIQSPQGTQEVPASAVGEFQRGITLFGGWGLYQQALAGSVKAQYLGQEKTADGAQADTLNWLASFGTVKLYFDSATHLLVEAKYTSNSMQGPVESDERWSDFRAAEGRQFPYQSVTYRSGAKYTDSTVQEIKINPSLDPSLFTKPASQGATPQP
ncbi:MAG TPA: pitrilysin family protein [Candidatus Acidoferrales bacterium]|nr:pitrilysin family protein [Candidatus Acidoferrales bacterium]